MEIEILKRAAAYFAKESQPGPKMIYTFIARACTDLPVSACCRVMRVSTSGFYAWQANPVTDKDLDDAYLTNTIVDIWTDEPPLLWLAPGPCRAAPRPGHPLLPQAGGAAHAPGGHRAASIGADAGAAPGGTSTPSPPTTW